MTTNPMRAALDAVAQQLHDDDPAEFHGTEATRCRFCAEPEQARADPSAVSVVPPATNQTEAGQAGEDQPETPLEKRLRFAERRNDELRAESLRRGKVNLEYAEKIVALERQIDEVRSQLGAEILRAGQAEAELRRLAAEAPHAETPDEAAALLALVRDFLDPDPCSFDHHGYCQAHAAGFGGEPLSCPHGRARKLLEAVDEPAVVAQPGKENDTGAPTTAKPEEGTRTADPLAGSATEYRVPVPEGGGTNLIVRRQGVAFGAGWSVAVPGWGGGRAWTAEGWQESISALSVDRLFCWPDAETAVTEARRALAAGVRQDGEQPQ